MSSRLEKHGQEGKAERASRLLAVKSLGATALFAAGSVLLPPLGAPLAAAALFEGIQAGGFALAQQHFKTKRLKK